MFESAKDRKAREEEQLRQQETLEAMKRTLHQVADSSSESEYTLKSMERNRESLDGALNQVVSMVHKIRKNEADQAKEEEELRRQLWEISQSLRSREESHRRGMETAKRKQQELCGCMEQDRGEQDLLSGFHQWAEGFEEELSRARQRITAMEEQSRSMSILSLNAAIEAGRMGDAGRKFVTVAEEVRSGAGEYCGAAKELGQELLQMQEAFQEAVAQLGTLASQMEEKDALLKKAAGEIESCLLGLAEEGHLTEPSTEEKAEVSRSVEEPSTEEKAEVSRSVEEPALELSPSGQLERLHKSWERTAKDAARQESCFEQILGQMEAAGESYMKEQQLLDQLQDWQRQIQKAVEEREIWG